MRSQMITDSLIKNCKSPEEKEIIIFGFNQGKIILISIIVTIVTGTFFKLFKESILLFVCLFPLRKFAGGFHAKTVKKCILLSVVILILAFLFIANMSWSVADIVIMELLSLIVILSLAPVPNENRPLGVYEKKVFADYTKKFLLIDCCLIILFLILKCYKHAGTIVTSTIIVAFCLIIGQIDLVKGGKER